MPEVSEVIKHLEGYKPDEHVAVAIWCEGDVIGRAKELGIKLTREQAQEILDEIDRKQDCELGISWTTLDVYIGEHK